MACQGTQGTLVYLEQAPADAAPQGASDAARASHATSWQIQLSGAVDTSFDVSMYVIDPFSSRPAIDELRAAGRTVACYISGGTWEPWRDDASQFPASVLGNPLEGYPSEKWLDIRSSAVRMLMQARIEQAKARACDAIELQSLDAHTADSGFPISRSDVLDYTTWLSSVAHSLGLRVGLSMSGDLVSAVEPLLDWGLTEQCLAYNECEAWRVVTGAGKPVFMIEFGSAGNLPSLCPEADRLGFELLIKRPVLDAFRVACPSQGEF
jgi:hypothetical protein